MSLEYALITDSSLPNEVRESDYYITVDKRQWLDLVDYSEGLVDADPTQKILFLIVAKGTPEQEAADQERKLAEAAAEEERLRKEEEERALLLSQKSAAELELIERERLAKEKADLEKAAQEAEAEKVAREKASLRAKSKSIFNALYKR